MPILYQTKVRNSSPTYRRRGLLAEYVKFVGASIYEGDIIQTYFIFSPGDAGYGISQKPFIVEWQKDTASFRGKKPNPDGKHLLDWIDFSSMQSISYEVIGNFYENPELINE